MSDPRPLQISFSHSILEHLGVNLYSNVPAVLAEVVANSWDADAENVSVDIDPAGDRIVITDDGSGMTRDEVIDRFLNIGYQKRIVEGNRTKKKNRLIMGRKGVGKLSVFAIAERIEVHTAKRGERTAFWMSRADIRKHIKEESAKRQEDSQYQEKPSFSLLKEFCPGSPKVSPFKSLRAPCAHLYFFARTNSSTIS